MVLEHQQDYGSQWEAICSIAEKFGATSETVRRWVRQAEVDGGARPGVSTADAKRIKELERENRELRRANEILKSRGRVSELERRGEASAGRPFMSAELGPTRLIAGPFRTLPAKPIRHLSSAFVNLAQLRSTR
jgi:transposase